LPSCFFFIFYSVTPVLLPYRDSSDVHRPQVMSPKSSQAGLDPPVSAGLSSALSFSLFSNGYYHRSALRSTSRFGFAGVPNALNLELSIMRLFEVALVVASWRVVLHCRRRNSPYPLRLACCARGRVVLHRSRGETPKDPTPRRSAAPQRLALLCAKAHCMYRIRGRFPTPFSLSLSLSLLFVHLPALRDMHEAPHHVTVLKIPSACDASRLWRLESSRAALLVLGGLACSAVPWRSFRCLALVDSQMAAAVQPNFRIFESQLGANAPTAPLSAALGLSCR
jgi:hypothetical protein